MAEDIPHNLTEAFVKSPTIKPVDRQELEKILEEQKLSLSGLTDD